MDDGVQDDDFVLVPQLLANTLQPETDKISLVGPLELQMDANAMLCSKLNSLCCIRDSVQKLLGLAVASLSCGICHEVLHNASTEIREMVTSHEAPSLEQFLHENGPGYPEAMPDWELYF
ncbi:hypothetical protein EDD15DRAFT_2202368 [Pisolithus albus]|nr:hypothetical protein EDD15DRAFT_2202368 [Pisolithus albus]